ncbi:MAG: class I SAM-dependent methyltransferase [Bacteroidetes bacterium]|nr:class I SAM-dependent methyltransferase [Bacteroidota bacterium]
MTNTIHRVKEFLKYQRLAKTKYYLHSPFVYQFYLKVLDKVHAAELQNINKLRNQLLNTHYSLLIEDMGSEPGHKKRLVSSIAAKATVPAHYGHVLYNITRQFQPHTIIELGTCLGIGTAYLAAGAPSSTIMTVEGSEALAAEAVKNLEALGIANVSSIVGNFDDRLPELLETIAKVDLAYVDGNHRYEPTMRYFHMIMNKADENTILIFDDIYWSTEMTQAWDEIKADPRVTLTIDIYRFGIAFLRKEKIAKEDFILRY